MTSAWYQQPGNGGKYIDISGEWSHYFTLTPLIAVKYQFGLSSDTLFQLGVIYRSYRQVLTPVNNSHHLLKLPIPDKFRCVTFHSMATKKKKLQH
jgi:hypothetical protein